MATRLARPTRFPRLRTINLQNSSLQSCNHKIDFFLKDPSASRLLCCVFLIQEKSTLFIIDKSDLHNKIRLYRCACALLLSPLSIPFNKEALLLVLKLVEFGIIASRHRGLAIVNYQSSGTTINRQPPKHQQQI